MRVVNRDVMNVCPKCGANLWLNEELMFWQCSATRCQWKTPAYTVPDKQPEDFAAPQEAPKCYTCQKPLEYDDQVRDFYPYWCEACNLWHNAKGDPQPGSYVRVRFDGSETRYVKDRCVCVIAPEVLHLPELEAVAAAAVACFVRSGKDVVYMPGAKTRNDLQQAVENLLASGWRPK